MRRSRALRAARGERAVQLTLAPDARRALAALTLVEGPHERAAAMERALVAQAERSGFPVKLSRDEEMRLAELAIGPATAAAFRETGHADAFLSGIAIALASDPRLPGAELRKVARELSPHVATLDGFRAWLAASPMRLARLGKLVDVELGRRAPNPPRSPLGAPS
jgi:hypothetical protein